MTDFPSDPEILFAVVFASSCSPGIGEPLRRDRDGRSKPSIDFPMQLTWRRTLQFPQNLVSRDGRQTRSRVKQNSLESPIRVARITVCHCPFR
jgi:hypothetical protein